MDDLGDYIAKELREGGVRPDDVVIIDGKKWRLVNPVISQPRHPAPQCGSTDCAMASHLLRSRVEPVEDTDD